MANEMNPNNDTGEVVDLGEFGTARVSQFVALGADGPIFFDTKADADASGLATFPVLKG